MGGNEGVVWCGVDEKNRGKEGCALLMSPRKRKGTGTHGWKEYRIIWQLGK